MKTQSTYPTNQNIIDSLKPLAKKLGMESILVSIEQWDGSKPYVDAKLYSKKKNTNGQSEISISATTPYDNFYIDALIKKLEADYLETKAKQE